MMIVFGIQENAVDVEEVDICSKEYLLKVKKYSSKRWGPQRCPNSLSKPWETFCSEQEQINHTHTHDVKNKNVPAELTNKPDAFPDQYGHVYQLEIVDSVAEEKPGLQADPAEEPGEDDIQSADIESRAVSY